MFSGVVNLLTFKWLFSSVRRGKEDAGILILILILILIGFLHPVSTEVASLWAKKMGSYHNLSEA